MPAPGPIYSISVDAVALVAATAKNVIEIRTPSTTGIVPIMWWVEFDGTTATNVPVKVEVGRYSASTTATTTSATPSAVNYGHNALVSQTTCFTNCNADSGSASQIELHRVSPTSGFVWVESLGNEWSVPVSSFWRMRLTAANAVNATVGVRWSE